MEAKRTRQRWTYAEFARLPTSGSTRYEVIDGELCVTPAPGRTHQRLVGRLFNRLYVFAEERGVGEVFISPFDVLFAEGDYVEPDILFVRDDRLPMVTDRGVEGAPDLVVEVLSPSTAASDRGVKLERYRLYAVPEYWVVDPDARTVEVWKLADGVDRPAVLESGQTLEWTPAPGVTLTLDLGSLFERITE